LGVKTGLGDADWINLAEDGNVWKYFDIQRTVYQDLLVFL